MKSNVIDFIEFFLENPCFVHASSKPMQHRNRCAIIIRNWVGNELNLQGTRVEFNFLFFVFLSSIAQLLKSHKYVIRIILGSFFQVSSRLSY